MRTSSEEEMQWRVYTYTYDSRGPVVQLGSSLGGCTHQPALVVSHLGMQRVVACI
jgi:hypothetical protein